MVGTPGRRLIEDFFAKVIKVLYNKALYPNEARYPKHQLYTEVVASDLELVSVNPVPEPLDPTSRFTVFRHKHAVQVLNAPCEYLCMRVRN